MKSFLLLLGLSLCSSVWGWGGRGHHVTCEASAFLVKNPKLQEFLRANAHVLGHLCLLPDTEWRGLQGPLSEVGNTTHYVNPSSLGLSLKDMPLSFKEVEAKFPKGAPWKKSLKEVGSNWWRGEQFFRLAVSEGKLGHYDRFLNYLGIMGHFIGDNGSAFHVIADYDGYEEAKGGLHDYFETQVVAVYDGHFVSEVIIAAGKEPADAAYLNGTDLLALSRQLALLSEADAHKILELEKVLDPSDRKKRIPAQRRPPSTVAEEWKPVIVKELARSALLQAKMMDLAFEQIGAPDLSKHHFRYPFKVPYVAPDYLKNQSR